VYGRDSRSETWPSAASKRRRTLLEAGGLALAILFAFAASTLRLPGEDGFVLPSAVEEAAIGAGRAMEEAVAFIRGAKLAEGLLIEEGSLGLIGAELTELTTTLGSLSAKRTAENPDWASVLVRRLWAAGLRKGDFVAAGMSGSFPGLNLALIEACGALGLRLAAVSSVTASTYGANQPGFTWPEMESLLTVAGLIAPATTVIVSGGAGDAAADLQPEGRALAGAIAARSAAALGARLLEPKGTAEAVSLRMSHYREAAGDDRIALYVNIGGTEASLGSSAAVLELSSGFLQPVPFDLSKGRGVMELMMEDGVPVLSLLNIRDLALKWGIPIE
jgi:poly-gamma-glutamate system protein